MRPATAEELPGRGQGGLRPVRAAVSGVGSSLPTPALVLAADHRARGVMVVERYSDYLAAANSGPAALRRDPGHGAADGRPGPVRRVRPGQRTDPSINRTGLAGAAFELDDRLVATVARAAADGWTGVKLMTRIDYADPGGAAGLALLGQVLEEARAVPSRGLDRAGGLAQRGHVPAD